MEFGRVPGVVALSSLSDQQMLLLLICPQGSQKRMCVSFQSPDASQGAQILPFPNQNSHRCFQCFQTSSYLFFLLPKVRFSGKKLPGASRSARSGCFSSWATGTSTRCGSPRSSARRRWAASPRRPSWPGGTPRRGWGWVGFCCQASHERQ